jgi:hypothetical protein
MERSTTTCLAAHESISTRDCPSCNPIDSDGTSQSHIDGEARKTINLTERLYECVIVAHHVGLRPSSVAQAVQDLRY